MKWLDEVMPDNEQWHKFSKNMRTLTEALKDSVELGNNYTSQNLTTFNNKLLI